MAWYLVALNELIHLALGGSLLLGAGCLAVGCCHQPVRRVRLIELTLLGCLLLPLASQLPWLPRWSAGWISFEQRASPVLVPPETASLSASPHESTPLGRATTLSVANDETPATVSAYPITMASAPTFLQPRDSESVSAPTAPSSLWTSLPLVVLGTYGALAAGFLLWSLYGLVQLFRLYRGASPVSSEVADLFLTITGPRGVRVRLLTGDRIESPFTFTCWRPVVMLPKSLCRVRAAGKKGDCPIALEGQSPFFPAALNDRAALRYCLAHEWSHVEAGDAWRWYLATAAQLLFFYQPLFWWLRQQLRLCQDYLADARAAEQGPEAEHYAEFLVGLARTRLGISAAALGISDGRSNLYRRITMLLHTRKPLEHRCLTLWSVAATISAFVLLTAFSTVRLDARALPEDGKKEAAKENSKEPPKDNPAEKAETLHYSGKVTDKDSGKPIAGATVTVRRSLYGDPEVKQENQIVQETKHTTDAAGKYDFIIPPEQSSQRYLYIELDVEHPDYAPRKRFGYALSMIRKNEKLGGRPFFEAVDLRPGKAITGVIKTPAGEPVAGIKVLAYSNTDKKSEEFEYGSFADTKTDAQGRFRLVVITPGPAVFWILPENYAPSTHGVRENKRGDVGAFTLTKGVRFRGKVLDAKGKPVAGVHVNAEAQGQSEELQGLPVADQINRSADTNDQGEFEMAPLPPGSYRVRPDEHVRDGSKSDRPTRRPLPAVFVAQKVILKDGAEPQNVEVRAVPHVTFEAQYVDAKGKPTRGHDCFIFGQFDGMSWFGQGKPDATGKIVAHVPHGLEKVQLDLMTNEHGVLRWRKKKDGPLNNNRRVDLGTLNDDLKGFEIVHYKAPILLVNVVDREGKQIKDFKVQAVYAPGKSTKEAGSFFVNGVQGDVYFEKQEDGRWRSSQMFPDEEVTITGSAEGYASKSEKVKIPEAETKELKFTLEKAADKKAEKK